MTAIKTRADLITAIQVERRRLEQNLAQINPASFCDPAVGGLWSLKICWPIWLPGSRLSCVGMKRVN